MGKRKRFAALNLILAGLIVFLTAAPPRAALAADEQIVYDVQDQQRALLETDLVLLCGQRPVLCAETRLFLETARQVPDLTAADYSYLRGELRDAFAQERQREEQGHGVWYGPGELAKLTIEQRGLQALERLKAAGPTAVPLIPALAHAIAALSSPAAEQLAGVASNWERGNAQQQAADMAWRDQRLTGDFSAHVVSAATGLDAGATLSDQVAALTLEPQAGPTTAYQDAVRAMVVEQLAGPIGYTPGATVGTMLAQSKLSLYDPAFARQYFPGVPTSQSRDAMTRRALDLREIWAQGEESYRLWREIDDRFKDLDAYAKLPTTLEDQRRATEQYQRHQTSLNTASKVANGLARLLEDSHPKLANEIRVTANAAIGIVASIDKYNLTKTMIAATSAAGWVKQGLNLVAAGMMGANIIGLATSVISLFQRKSAPPDPVLEQLKLLRQEIRQLRLEMHDRFDRVDVRLNEIMAKLDESFDKIDLDLGIIKTDLATVHRELWDVYSALNRLDSRFYQWLDAGFRRPLLEGLNGCIDYRRTHTGGTLPYQGTSTSFVECENLFHTWATVHAADALQAGTARDAGAYADERVFDELTSYRPQQGASYVAGYDAALNYLNRYLVAKGWPETPPFAATVLPNPRDWTTSARAYLTLAREWPEYDRRIDARRLDSIIAKGEELQRALGTLATDDTKTSRDNGRFYGRLVDNYVAKAEAVDNAVTAILSAYLAETTVGPIDLWGSPTQESGYRRAFPNLRACEGWQPVDLSLPASLWDRVPIHYRMAEQLKLGRLEVMCSEPTFVIVNQYYGECAWFYVIGTLQSGFTIRFVRPSGATTTVATLNYTSPEMTLHFNGRGNCGRFDSFTREPRSTFLENWTQGFNIRGWLDTTAPTLNQSADAALVAEINQLLIGHRATVLGRTRDALAPGGAQYRLVRELAGARALLDAFVTLGLPRAYQADELLHALLAGDGTPGGCVEIVADQATGHKAWQVEAPNRLYDEPLLQATIACAVANPSARLELRAPLLTRAETLRATLVKHLALIDSGAYAEGHFAIDATLGELRVQRELKQAPPLGRVAGVIFRDLDGDGLRDTSEPSVAGAALFIDLDGDRAHDEDETFTDRNGNGWHDQDEPFDDGNSNWRWDAGEPLLRTTLDDPARFGPLAAGYRRVCAVAPADETVSGGACQLALVRFNEETPVAFALAEGHRVHLPLIRR